MNPTFVLIPGMASAATAWAPMQRELALLGHRSLGVDLPGHGYQAAFSPAYQAPQDLAAFATAPSTLAGVGLAANVEHVAGIIRRAREHGPVILVGHSRGGMTVTAVANEVPELIDRLVYIAAYCPVELSPEEYHTCPENASSLLHEPDAAPLIGDPGKLGVLRMNWRTAKPETIDVLHRALFADGTQSEFLAYLNTMEPDETITFGPPDGRARAETWGRIPRSYIRLTEDRGFPVTMQDRMIAEADQATPGNKFQVHDLNCSHVWPLVHPEQAAAILVSLAAPAG